MEDVSILARTYRALSTLAAKVIPAAGNTIGGGGYCDIVISTARNCDVVLVVIYVLNAHACISVLSLMLYIAESFVQVHLGYTHAK